MSPTPLRICMLNADIPVPAVLTHRAPTYGAIFHSLLSKASPTTPITSTDFDVMQQQYPQCIDDFDAIIVSGSANSAYDDLDWIRKLDTFIRHVYELHPRIKIYGSCFGHQIICQSLLGTKVERDPQGWEIGVKTITLHDKFRKAMNFGLESMRLQFVHHDHVLLDALPRDWMTVGSTEHCGVQGVYELGRVLTLQGHFEFDRFVNSEVIKYFFGEQWDGERVRVALEGVDEDDDAVVAAGMILRFLLGGDGKAVSTNCAVVGGLLTPPGEE